MTPRQLRDAANGPWVIYTGEGCEYASWQEALREVPPGSTVVVIPSAPPEDLGDDGRTT